MDIQELATRVAALEELVRQRPIDNDFLYTPAEAAERLRCSTTNVYDLMSGGDLAFIRIGAGKKGFKIRGSDLLSFLDGRKEGGPKPRMALKHIRA